MKPFSRAVPRAALAFAFACGSVLAAGEPDITFGSSGARLVDFAQANPTDVLHATATMADGRIVGAGIAGVTLSVVAPRNQIAVVRLLPDGAPDPAFGDGLGRLVVPGSVQHPDGAFSVYAMALQADGRIVVAGTYTGPDAQSNDFLVARVRADGTGLDPTFGTNGVRVIGFDLGGEKIDVANAVAVQPDGRIVVLGGVRTGAATSDFAVVRLMPDGAFDTSFDGDGRRLVTFGLSDPGGESYDIAQSLMLQPDGKIVVAGAASSANGTDTVVARLLSNGALDSAFGNYLTGRSRYAFVAGKPSMATGVAWSELALDPNHTSRRIVVASETATAGTEAFGVAVLKEDGTLDPGFSGDGRQIVAFNGVGEAGGRPQAVTIDTGWRRVGALMVQYRRIVAGGYVSVAGGARLAIALARLNFDGSLDANFGNGGKSSFTSSHYLLGPPTSCYGMDLAKQGTKLVIGASCRLQSGGNWSPDLFAFMRVPLDD